MIYPCVFKIPSSILDSCPVRNHFKITPEVLIEGCKCCPYLLKWREEIKWEYFIKRNKCTPVPNKSTI